MTAVATKQIVLPPDVYDAFEKSALTHGGVGRGRYSRDAGSTPHCIWGHAARLGGAAMHALGVAGITSSWNDAIVEPGELAEWGDYCRRGNIVRGEDQ